MPPCHEQLPLEAYHDGELGAAERARVEEHLRTCTVCALELERIRAASQTLRQFQKATLPPARREELHHALDQATAKEDARLLRTGATLAVIAASTIIVGLAWLRVLSSTSAPPAAPAGAPTFARSGAGAGAGSGASSSWSSPRRAWEHVAITLRPDPFSLPAEGIGDEALQYAGAYESDLADWMIEGLKPRATP
jgi:anti-sigma factor RsiW